MRYYLKIEADNTISDAITYEHPGYTPYDAPGTLPAGINGGWWKFENGVPVEYPELKPVERDEEVATLKEKLQQVETDNLTTLMACAELYEMLLAMQPV